MKSIMNRLESDPRPFPKLMKNSMGLIILAIYRAGERLTGIIVYDSDTEDLNIGKAFEDYHASNFTDYEGSITLSND